jgi:sigma54-dependent transcription regulator
MDRNHLIDDLVNRLKAASLRSVLLTGLAGVGKSHLAHRALERCNERSRVVRSINGGLAHVKPLIVMVDGADLLGAQPAAVVENAAATRFE